MEIKKKGFGRSEWCEDSPGAAEPKPIAMSKPGAKAGAKTVRTEPPSKAAAKAVPVTKARGAKPGAKSVPAPGKDEGLTNVPIKAAAKLQPMSSVRHGNLQGATFVPKVLPKADAKATMKVKKQSEESWKEETWTEDGWSEPAAEQTWEEEGAAEKHTWEQAEQQTWQEQEKQEDAKEEEVEKANESDDELNEDGSVMKAMPGSKQGESGFYYMKQPDGAAMVAYFYTSQEGEWNQVTKPVPREEFSGELTPKELRHLNRCQVKDGMPVETPSNVKVGVDKKLQAKKAREAEAKAAAEVVEKKKREERRAKKQKAKEAKEAKEAEEAKEAGVDKVCGESLHEQRWPTAKRDVHKLLREELGIGNSKSTAEPEPEPDALPAFEVADLTAYPHRPIPKHAGMVRCYIKRDRSGMNKFNPVYTLFLEESMCAGGCSDFLMAGKKMLKNKTPNYRVFTERGNFSKDGEGFIGKLRGNFGGTDYTLLDNGCKPGDAHSKRGAHQQKELGYFRYELDDSGICDMEIAVPRTEGHEGFDDKSTKKKPIRLINKTPKLNAAIGRFVLNFGGRVTCASVKNFQLLDEDERKTVLYQFGRVGKEKFVCDFGYPFSLYQAFSIALSKFDSRESG
jgi:flagellar biosynthesis GTPase FlhF